MQVKKYFEKKVSLLSTSDVRYDGELYTVDPSEQSIALKHVNCMGTEGRRTGDQAIAPSDCTYEFIIFRAVNIRELYLDLGSGRRKDLTDEILIPLRSGQNNAKYPSKPSPQDMDSRPRRKVGYQSRSSQQAQQQYYDQGGYGGGGYRGSYDPNPRRRGYDEPPYPPLPRHQYPNYRKPQYDSYYDNGYYAQQQRGYQRQRAPQYYNAPSYNQGGYGGYNNGYNQRPMRQQQRGYNNNGYNNYNNRRGYGQQQQQQRSNRRQQRNGNVQAGTGAYLDNARLRGDEIDIKDQQDFDFGAAKNEFDLDDADKNAAHGLIVGKIESKDKDKKDDEVDDEETKQGDDDDDNTEEVTTEKKVKYDASKSFFDGLETETKRSKPRTDLQTQKDVDADTFGSVGATYKSRHIQNRGRRYQNNQYQSNNNNNQQSNGSYRSYNRQKNNNYQKSKQQRQQSNGYVAYGGNRWVKRG